MKKIVASLQPFELKQTLYVYEDGNKIDVVETTMEDLDNSIFALVEKYQIKEVDFFGPKQYSKGIKNQIEKKGIEKYSSNNFEIVIK